MKRFFCVSFFSFAAFLLIAPSAMAAKPVQSAATRTPLGIDVSWPQCGKRMPTNHAFGIVGVNGGLANTTNTCLKEQLVWANKAIGGTTQDKVQLYVNTANPGGLNTPSWPKDNTDPVGNTSPNPFGTCDYSDSLACAWQYGWNRAVEDVAERFGPAASAVNINANPASYIWWLDVETENTWKLSDSPFDTKSNAAVLEGMTQYFKSMGGRVGLYSTASQWGQIVGNSVSPSSNLNALNNWRPGGASLNTAKQACTATPLTTGGKVVLTQFISKGLDYNYSCM